MTLRSTDELAESLADVLDEQAHSPRPDIYRGCAAALEWVTGLRPFGPVTIDAQLPVNEAAMDAELASAIEVLHGERPMPATLSRAYLSGVEMTLAWALGQTDEPPL